MSSAPTLKIQLLREGLSVMPTYATAGAAGLDLHAALEAPRTLKPGERAAIPTGIAIALPSGYEGQVRARSGLASKFGIALVNAPGTIDEDYRGEVHVLLVNLGQEPYTFQPKDRVAQLVVAPVTKIETLRVENVGETERGTGGFGSTGR